MTTFNENWKQLTQESLNEEEMLRIRGGDGEGENPDPPIIK